MDSQLYTDNYKDPNVIVIDKNHDRSHYISRYLGILLKVLAIILSIFSIFILQIMGSYFLAKNDSDKGNSKNFVFYKGSDFKSVKYFGKSDLFTTVLNQMLKIIRYSETKSDSELSDFIASSARNFLFYGPPGTGKTLFVKRLTYLLNLKLNKKYNTKDKDLVRTYLIAPSDINDKFVGETERKIRLLFKEAREDKDFKATIIFIDEIDAFFGNRSNTGGEYMNRSKTEFLNLLSGINEDLRKNVFFMGATNRTSDIDPAFKRRLGRSIEFYLPTLQDIINILEEITADWLPKENRHSFREIAEIFVDRESSQSLISDVCKELVGTHGKNYKNLRTALIDLVKKTNLRLVSKENSYNNQDFMNHEELTRSGKIKFNIGHFML